MNRFSAPDTSWREELARLGSQPELLLSDNTWGERATGGMKLPGWLLRSIALTL